jgi:molecular chaperone HscB
VIDFGRNHFELFGLPLRYALDADALERAYRDLQQSVHPDRHAAADDTARRLAMQASARVNEAYRTLRDPVERARYLLALEGADPLTGSDRSLPVEFLERQLDRRERAARAGSCGDARALERVVDETREEAGAAERELGRLLGAPDSRSLARVRVRELAFLAKVVRDLEGQLADVDA